MFGFWPFLSSKKGLLESEDRFRGMIPEYSFSLSGSTCKIMKTKLLLRYFQSKQDGSHQLKAYQIEVKKKLKT